jgi:cell division inhibitor SepF
MSFLDTFWGWLGVKTVVEEEIIEMPVVQAERDVKPGANIVSIHSTKNLKVVVCEPEKFEEVQALADHLKNRRQIILNFESTPPEVSQRIIDFISGSLYSLDGQSQQLGRNIFLFAPSNVEITKDHRTLMRRNSLSGLEPYGGDR